MTDRQGRPCHALGCGCPDYNPGATIGLYVHCADCHHTEQVHAKATNPTSRQ
jgi:hypothetical protein